MLAFFAAADNLVAPCQGSHIPIPKRKLVLSPRNSASDVQKTLSSGSDVEGTGSGDSGFNDPSEFVQLRMDGQSKFKKWILKDTP